MIVNYVKGIRLLIMVDIELLKSSVIASMYLHGFILGMEFGDDAHTQCM